MGGTNIALQAERADRISSHKNAGLSRRSLGPSRTSPVSKADCLTVFRRSNRLPVSNQRSFHCRNVRFNRKCAAATKRTASARA
jgi:hypothetical protein